MGALRQSWIFIKAIKGEITKHRPLNFRERSEN